MSLRTGRTTDTRPTGPGQTTPTSPNGQQGLYARYGKRAIDLIVGFSLAILTLPILVVVSVIAGVVSGWPPLVRLPSIGKDGREFDLLHVKISPPKNDSDTRQRVAVWFRRWHLNQLPALWNVVIGDLSLIGPRPMRPGEHRRLQVWQQQRVEVKPGLVGLQRVNGGTTTSTLHYDILYVDRMSLATDARILARTLPRLRREKTGSEEARSSQPPLHVRLMIADIVLWVVGIPLATLAHYEFAMPENGVPELVLAIAVALTVHVAWATRKDMYRGRWKLISPEELRTISFGAAITTGVIMIAGAAIPLMPPIGALLMSGALYLVGAITARLSASYTYTRRGESRHNRSGRLLVFGAGEAGVSAVKAILADPHSELMPVGFLDDNLKHNKSNLLGLPVLGNRDGIVDAANRYGADTLLVAMPSAHPKTVDEIAEIGRSAGLDVQVLPPLAQWLSALLVQRADTPSSSTASARAHPSDARNGARKVDTFDLAVVGLGYVGLPLVLEASRAGLRVLGIDIDERRVDALNAGRSYIDDIASREVSQAISAGFVATTDAALVAHCDAVTIDVPTPLREGLPDLSAVIGASEAIGPHLRRGQLVVLESTTYPGTTEEVVRPVLESLSGLRAGDDFHLAYSPERIDPGSTEYGLHNTPKLVAGIDEASTEQAAMLYGKFSPVVTLSGTREAEMAKLLENTYRHVNIALINEMAIFCNQLGVDIWETIRGAATKPFGFQAFYPGPGVGGHCIPIDPNYLSYKVRQLGEQFRFIELAQEINEYMPEYVVDRALSLLETSGVEPQDATALILGVSYKPNIADTRETPATAIIELLQNAGVDVEYSDPYVPSFCVSEREISRRTDVLAAVAEADITIVHTPHGAFDLEAAAQAAALMFDLRGTVTDERHERL